MAQMTTSFFAEKLSRDVSFTAIIPTVTELHVHGQKDAKTQHLPKRTLYLLHGWNGSHLDWLTMSRVYELAHKYNVAIILPSGENSFYVDHPNGDKYGEFIGEELVNVTRELFPLSTKREDTWIGGLSMGGYGALRNGFYYSETFSKVAAFSSRITSKRDAPKREKLGKGIIDARLKSILGSDTLADLREEHDPYDLVLNRKEEQDIYIACGLEDALYPENEDFHEFLNKQKIEHEYFATIGDHDWDFWNEYIEKAIKWMVQ